MQVEVFHERMLATDNENEGISLRPTLHGPHILEGDLIVVSPDRDVHSGDVVVARVGGEVSVKRYEKAGATPVEILGKVVGLIRPGT